MTALNLTKEFPRLLRSHYAVTSPSTPQYNCIGWALGDNQHFWWPRLDTFWPADIPRHVTIAAFTALLSSHGFEECSSEDLELEVEKVALFVSAQGAPTHAARQLGSGMWTSKLGSNVDIAHELRGLEGKAYGRAMLIFSRARRPPPR